MIVDNSLGVAHFYYSRSLPSKAVGIAQIKAKPSTPADLVDIHNIELDTPRGPGALTVTPYPSGSAFDAVDLHNAIAINGSLQYTVENQFFELTPVLDVSGKPLFYKHLFDVGGIENVAVFDLNDQAVSGPELKDGVLYHSLSGAAYWVKYYADGILRTELLRYLPVMTRKVNPDTNSYAFTPGGLLTLLSTSTYWIRFTKQNGWSVLPPYNVPSNDPWYPRIRFGLKPVAKEWGRQPFMPANPYMMATWVPGKVVSTNIVEFERQPAYFDGHNYPDILVYDKDFNLKYALDGTEPDSRIDKGFLFPWMRSQFIGIDEAHARCHVAVDLDPEDQAFAFYSYEERDVIFRDLDINPFTNPSLKDKVIEFYFADRGDDLPPRD